MVVAASVSVQFVNCRSKQLTQDLGGGQSLTKTADSTVFTVASVCLPHCFLFPAQVNTGDFAGVRLCINIVI